MKTYLKVLLGLATLSPFLFFAGGAAFLFHMINKAPAQGFQEHFDRYLVIMNLAGLLFTVYFSAILVIFIVHAARNPNLEASGMRTTWILSLVILGPWIMPFYWFHHIWSCGTKQPKSGPLGLN